MGHAFVAKFRRSAFCDETWARDRTSRSEDPGGSESRRRRCTVKALGAASVVHALQHGQHASAATAGSTLASRKNPLRNQVAVAPLTHHNKRFHILSAGAANLPGLR